jgi:hypothetical protein
MVDGSKVNVIVQNQEGRSPASELDYQMMMVDGRWGDDNISEDLKDRLKDTRRVKMLAGSVIIDSRGNETILEEDALIPTSTFLWNELSIFTRDFRLANLDEKAYKQALHYTYIASDCLRVGMNKAFTVALTRVAGLLELSQSRDGFLRGLMMKKHSVEEIKEIGENPNLVLGRKQKK